MDDDIKTFILLKYEILTSNSDTWKRCEATYPDSVKSKWAWRCASDVEHHAKGYPEAEKCIRIAKLYRDGKATMEELKKAWNKVPYTVRSASYYTATTAKAAYAAYRAATAYYAASAAYAYYAASAAYAHAAYYASDATAYHAVDSAYYAGSAKEEKWNLYIGWLIEELCEYENTEEIPMDMVPCGFVCRILEFLKSKF